jgi:hypothetical protein
MVNCLILHSSLLLPGLIAQSYVPSLLVDTASSKELHVDLLVRNP